MEGFWDPWWFRAAADGGPSARRADHAPITLRSRARIDPAPVTRADWGGGIESSQVRIDPTPPDIESSQARIDPTPSDIESSQAGIDPAPPDIESSRVGIDPSPASIDPDSIGIDPSPVRVKSADAGMVIFSSSQSPVAPISI